MDTTYKIYCMGNVLCDKAGTYLRYSNIQDKKAERIIPINTKYSIC